MKGIHLEDKKSMSLVSWAAVRPGLPPKVRIAIPKSQELQIVVKPGDYVHIGQTIATPLNDKSVTLHASVSGTVSEINSFPHPLQGTSRAIEIISDQQGRKIQSLGVEREGWQNLSRDALLDILQANGVVGQSSMIPVHEKNRHNKIGDIHTLILNVCESEGYITSDHALMMSHPVELLKGAELLRKVANAERVVIAVEDNKLEPAETLKSKIYLYGWEHFEVQILPTRYPQGNPKLLLRDVLGWDFYEQTRDRLEAVQMHHAATALAIYEAVVMQKPYYERIVTVSGECVAESKNIWAPIGTTFGDAFKLCKGLLREPRKVLMGGPMKGVAQSTLDVPIITGTQALLALSKEVTAQADMAPCTRCGDCVDVCPVDISPAMIALSAERDLFEMAEEWGAGQCIECGNCSYVCPSKRPLVELIRYADTQVIMNKKEVVVGASDELFQPWEASISREVIPPKQVLEINH